jgi:NADH:ubiquinone oxidoreductase subunit H
MASGSLNVGDIVEGQAGGLSSWFIWLSAVTTALFCVAFVVLMPQEG